MLQFIYMQLSSLLANKKLIFIFIGTILLAELVWAGLSLFGGKTQDNTKVSPGQSKASSTLSLNASKTSLKVGESVTVAINVSAVVATDGMDVILSYDPKLLSVTLGLGKIPVAVGTIYSDYPLNQVDEGAGRIAVSGITSQAGGIIARGMVGAVTFTAKAPGKAKIAFDFTPGSTTDSNVIETKTAQDILGSVTDLEVNITP